MHLSDLSYNLKEVNEIETQTEPRKDLEAAMVAGGRKSHLEYKEKLVKGELDRVTVELSGKESEFSTKLAKKYKEIDNLTKQLKEMRDSANLVAKSRLVSYFDAEDEVLTRVLETASLTLTLSKKTVEETPEINFDGFYKELLVLLPEIEDKLKILLGKYTAVKKNERSPALRVSVNDTPPSEEDVKKAAKKKLKKENVELTEGPLSNFWNKVEELGSRLLKVFKVWGKNYDKKLNSLKQKMGEFAVEESLEEGSFRDNSELLNIWNKFYSRTKPSQKQLANLEEHLNQGMDEKSAASSAYYGEVEESLSEADGDMGYYYKANKKDNKSIKQPFRMENKAFLYTPGSLPIEIYKQPLTKEEKFKLIDLWNARSNERNDIWEYYMDPITIHKESIMNEQKFVAFDKNDLLDKVKETHEKSQNVFSNLLKLEMATLNVAANSEPGADIDFEYVMANKFKQLSYDADELSDKIKKLEFDIEDHLQSKKPVKEEIKEDLGSDSHEELMKLAQETKNLFVSGSKDTDKLSLMVFGKNKLANKKSLYEIIVALQEMDAEQYKAVKHFVKSLIT